MVAFGILRRNQIPAISMEVMVFGDVVDYLRHICPVDRIWQRQRRSAVVLTMGYYRNECTAIQCKLLRIDRIKNLYFAQLLSPNLRCAVLTLMWDHSLTCP